MELKQLLVGLEGIKGKGKLDIEIKGVESNSQKVENGYVFVALKGFTVDGHEYIDNAIIAGAVAVVVQEGCDMQLIKKLDLIFFMNYTNAWKNFSF